jgi:hypothetical protein
MGKVLALAFVLAGCVTEVSDEEQSTTEDGLHGDDSGWGAWCNNYPRANTAHLWNECYNDLTGEEGICDVGVCRRQCVTSLDGCPRHFHAIPGAGGGCVCVPNMNGWDYDCLAPAVFTQHEGPFTQNP